MISSLRSDKTAGVVEPVINDSAYDIVKIVSDNISNVGLVAAIDGDVTTVAEQVSAIAAISSLATTGVLDTINSSAIDIALLADHIDNTISTDITEVANAIPNINLVAPVSNELVALAPLVTEIATLGDVTTAAALDRLNTGATADNIDTVAAVITNVNTVATNIVNVNAVADISVDVTTVVGISTKVTSLYNDKITLDSLFADKLTLDGLFNSKAAIGSLYIIQTKLESLFADKAILDSLFADKTTLDRIYVSIANIDRLNTGATANNIDTLVTYSANIDTVAGAIANVNLTGASIANVNTVAANIFDVNNFADTYYGSLSVAPTIGTHPTLTQGDLYFDTVLLRQRHYNGTDWIDNPTDLTTTTTTTTVTVVSSNGTDAVLPAATPTVAGVLTGVDKTKLDGIEALADVTDTVNVTAAGALMDSELASIEAVKSTTAAFLVADETKLDGIEPNATADQTASEVEGLYEGIANTNKYTDSEKVTNNKIDNTAVTSITFNADGTVTIVTP